MIQICSCLLSVDCRGWVACVKRAPPVRSAAGRVVAPRLGAGAPPAAASFAAQFTLGVPVSGDQHSGQMASVDVGGP